MANIAFVVDGFNLYHSLKTASNSLGLGKCGTKWLDLNSLFGSYRANIGNELGKSLNIPPVHLTSQSVHYFSALADHREIDDAGTTARHQQYLDCLMESGVNVEMSRFKRKDITCPLCNGKFIRYEEKETDVAIALKVVELAATRKYDVIALVSGDTDIAPALRSARLLNPGVKLACLFPYKRKNKELAQLTDFSMSMSAASYQAHQFVDPFSMKDGRSHCKPGNW